MEKKDRILELVRQGVISNDEAIDLLENLGQEKSKIDQEEDFKVFQEEFEKQEVPEELDIDQNLKDSTDQLQEVIQKLKEIRAEKVNKEEELETLDNLSQLGNLTPEQVANQFRLRDELLQLNQELNLLEKRHQEKKDQVWQLRKQYGGQQIDRLAKIGQEEVTKGSKQVGSKLQELGQVLTDFFNRYDTPSRLGEIVDRLKKTPVVYDFTFKEGQPTIIDVQAAHLDILVRPNPQDKIQASFKGDLLGNYEEADQTAALLARVQIEESHDKLSLVFPNNKVHGQLVVYLPERQYDYVSIKLLQGDIILSNIDGQDFYLKVSSGDIELNDLSGVMLEAETVTGDIYDQGSKFTDAILTTTDGDVTLRGGFVNQKIETVTGNIRASLTNNKAESLNVRSTNGTIKVAVNPERALNGHAQSAIGQFKNKAANIEESQQTLGIQGQDVIFTRALTESEERALSLDLETSSSNILLKDNSKN